MRDAADVFSESMAAPKRVNAGSRARYSPAVWLNVVCLDAPIVAVTWQWFFTRSFHLSLGAPAQVALFLTAWLIYLADRFGDAFSVPGEAEKSLRERFCRAHLRAWLIGLVAVALLDGWAVLQLNRRVIEIGILLALASAFYLAVNYWLGKIWRILPLKEVCIGLLFAGGTVASLRPVFDSYFVAGFLLFAALCVLNCVCIAAWELELDLAQGKNSIATRWPQATKRLRLSTRALALLCVTAALLHLTPAPIVGSIGTSALLLGGLDLMRGVVRRDERTAWADLVLLTPLLFFLFAQ